MNIQLRRLQTAAQQFLHYCRRKRRDSKKEKEEEKTTSSSSQSEEMKDNCWFVGIHVRRTDYINHLNVTEGGKSVTVEYFGRAIARLEENLHKDFDNVPELSLIHI